MDGEDVARQDLARDIDAALGAIIAAGYRHGRALGSIGEAAGKRDSADGRHATDIRVAARLVDLSQDIERPIGQNFDADLRVDEIAAIFEGGFDVGFELTRRPIAALDRSEQRQREKAAAIEDELA